MAAKTPITEDIRGTSNSVLEIRDKHYENCIFQGIKMQHAAFINCHFERCDFVDCILGLNVEYNECTWERCKIIGKYGKMGNMLDNAGKGTYKSCTFNKTNIQGLYMFFQAQFSDCRFSGKLSNCMLNGGDTKESTSFRNCDFTKATFSKLGIRGGIDIESCQLPAEGIRVFDNQNGQLTDRFIERHKGSDTPVPAFLELGTPEREHPEMLVFDLPLLNKLLKSEAERAAFEEVVKGFEILKEVPKASMAESLVRCLSWITGKFKR